MAYKGSDLSQDFKDFFKREKKRLTTIFKEKGCTNIKLDYGFYYFSGFFTAPSGQIYYLCSLDTRQGYRIYMRTAKDYKDYTGGHNQWVGTKKEELMAFKLV